MAVIENDTCRMSDIHTQSVTNVHIFSHTCVLTFPHTHSPTLSHTEHLHKLISSINQSINQSINLTHTSNPSCTSYFHTCRLPHPRSLTHKSTDEIHRSARTQTSTLTQTNIISHILTDIHRSLPTHPHNQPHPHTLTNSVCGTGRRAVERDGHSARGRRKVPVPST